MINTKDRLKTAEKIALKVKENGGCAYFVGGFVRDKILGIENKDIDIEVHGILASQLKKIISEIGTTLEMGESFGIYTLKGSDIDIALPRKEKLRGKGHRDFDVFTDPFIGTKNAAKRRDFTVNALMQDVLTGEIIDHFGGTQDLKNKILRHVDDESFPEDPLRVLRLAQFAARFGFSVAPETKKLAEKIDLSSLSKERVEGELKKALLKSENPSLFFELLFELGQLGFWFPEIKKLHEIEQNPKYHPEGDVFVHTMQVLDIAASYREKTVKPYPFMLSALMHDLGKIAATEIVDGEIHAYAHETKGLSLTREALCRFTKDKTVINYVVNMCKLHMKPNIIAGVNAHVKTSNRMFDESIEPTDLIYLALSDSPNDKEKSVKYLFERFEIFKKTMAKPYVTGKDLIDAGLLPDENFSEILAYSHKLRLAGIKKESALKQTLVYAQKMKIERELL